MPMTPVRYSEIEFPTYDGLESENEHVVYVFLRGLLSERGHQIRVKRSGRKQIDSIIRSYASAIPGRGSCDAYVFAGPDYSDFKGLVELESAGKLEEGISQVKFYAESFTSDALTKEQVAFVKRISAKNDKIVLAAYDGSSLWCAHYWIAGQDRGKTEVLIDRLDARVNGLLATSEFLDLFEPAKPNVQEGDERGLAKKVTRMMRGHEAIQKNKALIMTTLASMYGATEEASLNEARDALARSQGEYEKRILDTYNSITTLIDSDADSRCIAEVYERAAGELYTLASDKGLDLYGYIYEEFATREGKKERGEYYTPRHTIAPILRAVMDNYLKWDRESLGEKTVFDPFCGSGGFLYEYINMCKARFGTGDERADNAWLNDLADKSLYGCDKNSILAAYLNLYLVGDGNAHLEQVKSTINWKYYPLVDHLGELKDASTGKVKQWLNASVKDVEFLFRLYTGETWKPAYLSEMAELRQVGAFDELVKRELSLSPEQCGCVDLLLTNVPYGSISDDCEKWTAKDGVKCGGRLEAHALKECIDFLKPAVKRNGRLEEPGGIAVVIVPDSILENPTHKPIRDYLIARCTLLAVVKLPAFTFSPYAMEATYALVFQKRSPLEFDVDRDLSDERVFMYWSCCDGRANSVNRYPTGHMKKANIKVEGGTRCDVVEFIHDDFNVGLGRYYDGSSMRYASKLERAWSMQATPLNPEWDQERVTENWVGGAWAVLPGRKWGFYTLERFTRTRFKEVSDKRLADKVAGVFDAIMVEGEELMLTCGELRDACRSAKLTAKQDELLGSLDSIEIRKDEFGEIAVTFVAREDVPDIDLNPDSVRYLQAESRKIAVDELFDELRNVFPSREEIIDFFAHDFVGAADTPLGRMFTLRNEWSVDQGVGFSKQDAYMHPGDVPVYTAATDGPPYYCASGIEGRTMVEGPGLIWSRKGAKAGSIQLFAPAKGEPQSCYITDVSGIIRKKKAAPDVDLTYLQYYIAGQVRRLIQAKANNAQLNKSSLEALRIYVPENHEEIGDYLRGLHLD